MLLYILVEINSNLWYYICGEIMRKILTLVVDGIGLSDEEEGNALLVANMPNYRKLMEEYPRAELDASGESVGLREGQAGNAAVGYKTISAGKILRQRSSFVNEFVDRDSLATNGALRSAIEQARKHKSTIHVMGLMSDAGINSNIKDTISIIEYLKTQDVKMVVDFIADGKDTEAKSALKYIEEIEALEVPIATVCGRYYAMDEEEKWDRIKIYYDLIRNGVGLKVKEIPLALKNCYIRNITDEFLPPMIVEQNRNLKNHDVIIWTNFKAEGSKEILMALSNPNEMEEFEAVGVDNLKLLIMYPVDPKIDATVLINEEDDLSNNLGKYFGKLGMTQARISLPSAERLVTYHFNGESEDKIPKCNVYQVDVPEIDNVNPSELALVGITKQILKSMEKDTDFILASIDTIDVVGHTGDFEATVKTLEFFDECLGKILEGASLNFYTIFLTSVHGNVEKMKDENGVITTHTTNKVPLIITDNKLTLKNGTLSDFAPTLLKYMDIGIPESMKESKVLIDE